MLSALAITVFGAAGAFAQMTPQQLQQSQLAEERILQREAQEQAQEQWLTAQHRHAQFEEERQLDRQRVEDQFLRTEQQRQAQAVAEQQLLYLLEQAAQRQLVKQQRQTQSEDQPQTGQEPQVESRRAARMSEQEISPSAPSWSYKNMSDLDKAGLVALGALLAALAFAAGIVPAKLAPKWATRVLPPTRQ